MMTRILLLDVVDWWFRLLFLLHVAAAAAGAAGVVMMLAVVLRWFVLACWLPCWIWYRAVDTCANR